MRFPSRSIHAIDLQSMYKFAILVCYEVSSLRDSLLIRVKCFNGMDAQGFTGALGNGSARDHTLDIIGGLRVGIEEEKEREEKVL